MSRSYRKTPIVKDNGRSKKDTKKQANKKVRKSICGDGGDYKKLFESGKIGWKFFLKNKDKKGMSK